jgi:hypothetical protein
MAAHIPDSSINALALGTLSRGESLRVQRHLYKCKSCLLRLIEIEAELRTQDRSKPGQTPVKDQSKPLYIVHDTAGGPIHSRAQLSGGKWLARHWGRRLDGATVCETINEANEFLLQSFAQMFPEVSVS